MNEKSIAFITCVNDTVEYKEALYYIEQLNVPVGYTIDTVVVQGADCMAAGYQAAMQSCDAKYKIYMHQDVFIHNRNFLKKVIEIFQEDNQIGLIGMVGRKELPEKLLVAADWDVGNITFNGGSIKKEPIESEKFTEVEAVDGLILITQYDVDWRSDLFDGWDFYDISQCEEFRRVGYKVVVPYQGEAWCYHDNTYSHLGKYFLYQKVFCQEYQDIKKFENRLTSDDYAELEKTVQELKQEMQYMVNNGERYQLWDTFVKMKGKVHLGLQEFFLLTQIDHLEEKNIGDNIFWKTGLSWEEIRLNIRKLKFKLKRIEYGLSENTELVELYKCNSVYAIIFITLEYASDCENCIIEMKKWHKILNMQKEWIIWEQIVRMKGLLSEEKMISGNKQKFVEIIEQKQKEMKSEKIMELLSAIEAEGRVETVMINETEAIQTYDDGKVKWQLNSSMSPESASGIWAKQFATVKTNEHSIFIVFGMSDGISIKKLMEYQSECAFWIYEPSIEIFNEAIDREIWLDIIKNKHVRLYVKNLNDELFYHHLQDIIDYTNFNLVNLAVLPNYDRIFNDDYQKFRGIIEDVMKLVVYTRNTQLERIDEITNNMYKLFDDIIHQYSVQQLSGCVKLLGWEDIPAILVAAGPSLDENIAPLREFKKRGFVLAVDTALNTLLENDIIPDLTISVDSRKPMELFKHPKFKSIPIVLSQQSNEKLLSKNQAMHFYEIDEESYLNKILIQETGKAGIQLPTGGSVANNALSLLVLMGFQTIILVGQDLAYPNMQEHTQNAYEGKANRIQLEEEDYILVDDVNGDKVYTRANMNIYRKWIEYYIAGYKEIKVINTSNQGAYISGTQKMSLEECFQLFGKKEINATQLWNQIPAFLDEKELAKIHEKVCNIPKCVDEIETEIKNGIMICGKAEQLCKVGNYKKMKDVLQQISKIIQKIEDCPETILLRPYTIKAQYEVQEKVFQYFNRDAIENEMMDGVLSAKLLMDAYKIGIELFRKEMFKLVPQKNSMHR